MTQAKRETTGRCRINHLGVDAMEHQAECEEPRRKAAGRDEAPRIVAECWSPGCLRVTRDSEGYHNVPLPLSAPEPHRTAGHDVREVRS
jgi:hypothetical protein